ncbi:YceD family protein [Allohahella marinimesophila]|uniref:Large ribosomal RNA subunit accumulation protein YceD n=1 Tax=Allohahella marinimesophila TaxID=1054972 RepID=A0ABP7NPU9_9GAMM
MKKPTETDAQGAPKKDFKAAASLLPARIDADSYCDRRISLNGNLQVRQLKRLDKVLLDSSSQTVNGIFEFDRDELKQSIVRGTISASVFAECQRCGQAVGLNIEAARVFGLARSEADFEAMPVEYEPVLLDKGSLELHTLVEDELLLTVPQFVYHEPLPVEGDTGDLLLKPCDLQSTVSVGSATADQEGNEGLVSEPASAASSTETHRPFEGLDKLLGPKR